MIYIHNGTKEVDRFDMPHCAFTKEQQPWIRAYIAALPEDESHRGYETIGEAFAGEPDAFWLLHRMVNTHAVY